MKSYFLLLLLTVLPVLSLQAKQSELENEIAKIQNPNTNVINAIRKLEKDSLAFMNNTNEKKNADYVISFLESSSCMKAFGSTIRDRKYKDVLEYVQKIAVTTVEKVGKYESDKIFIEKITKSAEEMNKVDPIKLCRFKIVEDEEFKSDKAKKEKAYAQFKNLMEIKKNVHPKFLKVIENLEAQKESLKFGMSSDGIPFIPNDYEYNFVLMYNLQLMMDKDEVRIIANNLANKFKMKPEQVYEKYCRGQLKYDSVPEEELKYMYCFDDNLSLSGANCNPRICIEKLAANKIDPATLPLEIKTSFPILVLQQVKNEECKKNSSFSFEASKALIRSISNYSNLYGINDFEKCPIEFSVLPSNSSLRVIEMLLGEDRLRFPSNTEELEQVVVEDNQKNRYEISKKDFISLKQPNSINGTNKILEFASKNGNWDALVNRTYTFCDPNSNLNSLKKTRKIIINFSKMTNSTGFKQPGCEKVKFNSPLDLQWALLFFDVKEE
jgi:hypothetical protein